MGLLSLQTSLFSPNFPTESRRLQSADWFRFFVMAGFCGEVFVSLRGGFFEVELHRKTEDDFCLFLGAFFVF